MGGAPYASQGVPCARSRRARVRLRVRFLRGLCAHLPRGHHMPVLYSPSGWFHLPFPAVFHENTRVPPFHWWVPDFRSHPSAASLLRKFQFLPSPPPPLWHPAYADSSASRQTARWTHVNKGLQASMSSASTSSSYCLKNEVYKIKITNGTLRCRRQCLHDTRRETRGDARRRDRLLRSCPR